MTNNLLYALSIVTLTTVLGTLALIAFWLFYPYQPLTLNVSPLPVSTPQVRPGENLVYTSDTCRNVTGEVEVLRTFINDVLINVPKHTFYQATKECVVYENASVQVPGFAPPGMYHLEITSFFQVNPIRTIPVKVVTEPFEVIE